MMFCNSTYKNLASLKDYTKKGFLKRHFDKKTVWVVRLKPKPQLPPPKKETSLRIMYMYLVAGPAVLPAGGWWPGQAGGLPPLLGPDTLVTPAQLTLQPTDSLTG